MPAHLQLIATLLSLACVSSAELGRSAADQDAPIVLTGRGLLEPEQLIRASLYHACGGDRELRCQQFEAESRRSVVPPIALRDLHCTEAGRYLRRVRECAFSLAKADGPAFACSVTYRESVGPHSLYWSDETIARRPASTAGKEGVIEVAIGRSSLACGGKLLSVTSDPEPLDLAPKSPPKPFAPLATLISDQNFSSDGIEELKRKATTVRLRVGSHGLIDACTVIQSSGNERFDHYACSLLRSRAGFEPARNARGEPVATEIDFDQPWPAATRSPARP